MDAPDVMLRGWFRWQFSLRTLLLFMIVVGVAISVYRWPWEVVTEQEISAYLISDGVIEHPSFSQRVTTYRRDWRGQPVKHGLERFYLRESLIEERSYYDGLLNGVSRCFNSAGQLTEERTFREGMLHGPFRIGDGQTWVQTGGYFREQKDGDWQVLTSRKSPEPDAWLDIVDQQIRQVDRPSTELFVPDDPIQVHQHWRRGERHGRWEWRTLAGELLNTGEYLNNELIRWNGRAEPAEFWDRMAEFRSFDWELNDRLEQPADNLVSSLFAYGLSHPKKAAENDTEVSLFRQTSHLAPAVVHYALPIDAAVPLREKKVNIGGNLLEHALLHGLAVDYRYGGLWFVPADEVTGCHDATGVERVKFTAGSSQAREWDELIEVQVEPPFELSRIKEILAKTSIKLDLSAWDGKNMIYHETMRPRTFPSVRKRRDALGLALYRTGLQCEQRGDTLAIKLHWTKERIASQARGER